MSYDSLRLVITIEISYAKRKVIILKKRIEIKKEPFYVQYLVDKL